MSRTGNYRPITPPVDRFWAHVAKGPECWLWSGAPTSTGYGKLAFPGGGWQSAHRFSWELHNGPVPDGLQVLHHCDVPLCVNPSHLFLGTHLDNMADMRAKGRYTNRYISNPPTHCPHGHEYTEANVRRDANHRHCRACENAHRRPRKAVV